MAWWWIIRKVDGAASVFLQEADTQVHARLKAPIAGHGGNCVEMHRLDNKTAEKDLVGRALKPREACRCSAGNPAVAKQDRAG
jgi:hypothetical protein